MSNGMNNTMIICNELVNHKIYTEEALIEMLEKGIMPPCHSYNEWKRYGFQVKKGEKATIRTRLWTYNNKPVEAVEGEEAKPSRNFYLNYAYLFLANQVEAIKDAQQTLAPFKEKEATKAIEMLKGEEAESEEDKQIRELEEKLAELKKAKADRLAKAEAEKVAKVEKKTEPKKNSKTEKKAKSVKTNSKKTTRKNVNEAEGLTLRTSTFDGKTKANQIVNMIRFEAVNKLGEIKRSLEMPLDSYVQAGATFKKQLASKWGIV